MSLKKFAINYGGVLGLFLVLSSVILYVLGVDDKESIIPSLLNHVIMIFGITYSILQFRDIYNGGYINYTSSLKLGVSIAFFASVILTFYSYIYINFINAEYVNEMIEFTEQKILSGDSEVSEEMLETNLSMIRTMLEPQWFLPLGILGSTFMGVIYSLIISFFVKKQDLNQLS
ncbi:MAG: DUF4199 domain-containing protein [Bacteroidota bacterium]|nr:DUF4199 domain-containing protein [Bacteroidota bacterium]